MPEHAYPTSRKVLVCRSCKAANCFLYLSSGDLSVGCSAFFFEAGLSFRKMKWLVHIPIPLVQKKTSRILLLLKKPNKAFSFAFARISEDCFLYPSNLPFPCHPLTVFSTFAVLTRAQPQQLQQLSSAQRPLFLKRHFWLFWGTAPGHFFSLEKVSNFFQNAT